ncbi:MAG: UDP-N-acetylmuramoyl-L-alanyl-D-glutamate--2,6-diaminopimelate ligase [Candidatus Omnitrophota bacterium]
MNLRELVRSIEQYCDTSALFRKPSFNVPVRGISCNSKTVQKNFVFVAVQGARKNGNVFIQEALHRGASAIVFKPAAGLRPSVPRYSSQKTKAVFIEVTDTRKAAARLAAEFYHHPSSKMKITGITGTNGKTTVSYLIEAILKESGATPAVIGTVNYRFQDCLIPSKNTTPGPFELQAMFDTMARRGVDSVVMEVSSHALDQERCDGIDFFSAVFTNLTHDHLDYHQTLKKYFHAKSKLFKRLSSHAGAVINNDDPYGRKLKRLTQAKVITYGIERKSDVMARDISMDMGSTRFTLLVPGAKMQIKSALIGRHNVYNILAAVAWGIHAGLDVRVMKQALKKFKSVPGRLERVNCDRDICIFVDYAHTDDALKNVIGALRQVAQRKIVVVFGCGGERDKAKRPKMGRIASLLADYVIITSDNPRSEDPALILDDITDGITKDNYCVVADRCEAIKKALSIAGAKDIVLVAGKGHEDYQILKNTVVAFDDRKVIKKCLQLMN